MRSTRRAFEQGSYIAKESKDMQVLWWYYYSYKNNTQNTRLSLQDSQAYKIKNSNLLASSADDLMISSGWGAPIRLNLMP